MNTQEAARLNLEKATFALSVCRQLLEGGEE